MRAYSNSRRRRSVSCATLQAVGADPRGSALVLSMGFGFLARVFAIKDDCNLDCDACVGIFCCESLAFANVQHDTIKEVANCVIGQGGEPILSWMLMRG